MAGSPDILRRGVAALIGLFHASAPLRFLIVGGFNTVASFSVYLLLVHEGVVFWLANFGSLIFGICLGFFTQGRLVFRNRDVRRFPRFLLSWATIYAIQTGLIWLFVRNGLTPSIAGLVVLPVVVLASFVTQRFFVFRRRTV